MMKRAKFVLRQRRTRWGVAAISILAVAAALVTVVAQLPAEAKPIETPKPNVLVTITLGKIAGADETTRFELVARGDGSRTNLVAGQRIPIPATTFNTSATSNGAHVPVVSLTYQNIGFEAGLRANVMADRHVWLEASIEHSRVSGKTKTAVEFGSPVIQYTKHDFKAVLKENEPLRTTLIGSGEPQFVEIQVDLLDD